MIRWRPVRGACRVHRRTSDGMSLTSRDSMTREPGSWPWPDTLDVALRAGGRIPASDPLRDDGPGLDIPPERGSPRGWPRMTRVRRFVMSADAGISLSNLARAAQWACPRAASIPSRIVSSPTANLSSDVA
jgi:hypothetical protein